MSALTVCRTIQPTLVACCCLVTNTALAYWIYRQFNTNSSGHFTLDNRVIFPIHLKILAIFAATELINIICRVVQIWGETDPFIVNLSFGLTFGLANILIREISNSLFNRLLAI